MAYVYCPNCESEFDGDLWVDGQCPDCGLEYVWDECYDHETDDSDVYPMFLDKKEKPAGDA